MAADLIAQTVANNDLAPWLVGGGVVGIGALAFRTFVRLDGGRETLLDRYQADRAADRARIAELEEAVRLRDDEIRELRIALDTARDD